MEDTLDRIESADLDATDILSRFYANFKKSLDAAADGMLSVKGVGIPTELPCPECGRTLHIKVGKNGHFLACSGYPDCTHTHEEPCAVKDAVADGYIDVRRYESYLQIHAGDEA